MKALIIAAHPDDETVGCGGTIAKHVENGDDVYLCIVTEAYTPDWPEKILKTIKSEIGNVCKILKIRKTFFLHFPTVKLDTISQKQLNDSIHDVVTKVKPEIVYVPHKGDLNRDHRLVFEAALVATRPVSEHKIKRLLSYETLSVTEWGNPIEAFTPNVYIDISDTIKTKIEAVKAYKSQLRSYPHPRSLPVIEALARKRGSEIGVRFAEAFILIRELVE
jgi:LmbE family N-acetylglucosaminyl deacetylase